MTPFFNLLILKIALPGDAATTFFLPRLVGMKKVKNLAFRSTRVGLQEAVEMGLASKVIPADDFERKVREIATDLA